MQTIQSSQFGSALSAWMKREYLTTGRAARWLGVKCSDLTGWIDGTTQPSPAQITHVLGRIAAGSK